MIFAVSYLLFMTVQEKTFKNFITDLKKLAIDDGLYSTTSGQRESIQKSHRSPIDASYH